ncbi:MAG TPA: DUF3617 domain-containing protein [Allosphingosinicella sp.]|jgi:hypothetical protein|nr:DUF3617 domain-containing protein [Allosphingosinicella sp.]
MKRLIILAPAIVLVTACGGGGGDSIRPGQWDMTMEMTSIEAPGAPDAMVQQMRSQLASQRRTQSQCVTAEEARNPSRSMTGQNPAGCEFSDTTWSGGNIRVRATCRPAGGPQMQMSLEGTYGAEQINSRINMNMEMPNPAGGAPMQIRVGGTMTGRRTGDCRS